MTYWFGRWSEAGKGARAFLGLIHGPPVVV